MNYAHVWPRVIPSRPPIQSLIRLTAGSMTAPIPLSADIKNAGKKAEEDMVSVSLEITAAEKEVATISEQLKNISAVDVNRWNRRSTNMSERNKVEGMLRIAQEKRSAAIAKQTVLNTETQLVRGIIRLQEQTEEAYADFEKEMFLLWKREYGEETPITSIEQIGGTREVLEGGLVRHHMPLGTDVTSIYRRLRMGGYSKVRILDTQSECWVEVRP
jgi:hypothetical protein